MQKKNIKLAPLIPSFDLERLLDLLKKRRAPWCNRIRKAVKTRLESASWATEGVYSSCGASLP